jgi:hypothetical protein
MTKRGHEFITNYQGQTLTLFTNSYTTRIRKNQILARPPPSATAGVGVVFASFVFVFVLDVIHGDRGIFVFGVGRS